MRENLLKDMRQFFDNNLKTIYNFSDNLKEFSMDTVLAGFYDAIMRYLIIHDGFPGQFVHLYRHLLREGGHEIVAASRKGSSAKLQVRQIIYEVPAQKEGVRLGASETAILLGYDLYRGLKKLKSERWVPDFILYHAAYGASYFVRDLFPDARITAFMEWYYQNPNIQQAKDPRAHLNVCAANAARNSIIARDFDQADAVYTPTDFQKHQFPDHWRPRINVCHEGIDTNLYRPADDTVLAIGDKQFTHAIEIITYAARGMEKTRGFPQFMQAIAAVQKQRPQTHVIIAAADRICYDPGGRGKAGLKNWAEKEVDYDPARTHFAGLLPEPDFVKLLQLSSLHCYFSIPFVLSWSCLNAMSVGAPVLASDNAAVREVIEDGVSGVLVDSSDPDVAAEAMISLLEDETKQSVIGAAAREVILKRFELGASVDRQLSLIRGS